MLCEVQTHGKYLEFRLSGDADMTAFKGLYESHLLARKDVQGTSVLVDMTVLNASPMTISDMLKLKRMGMGLKARLEGNHFAFLVSRNLEYGLVRMWMPLVQEDMGITMAVFRSREKALDWLLNPQSPGAAPGRKNGASFAASFIGM